MRHFLFLNSKIFFSKDLVSTLMSLEHLSIVYITGVNSKNYLNQQFSIDLNEVTQKKYKIGAHCNYNGKVWGIFIIFLFQEGYIYIISKEIVKQQILELKKYSIFSKIKILILNNFKIFGFSGKNSIDFLNMNFKKNLFIKNNIEYFKNFIILKIFFPIPRFLIIISKNLESFLFNFFLENINTNNFLQWLLLDMESYFPIFSLKMTNKFLPQILNLKFWDAINFSKGCYYGQETIFKMEIKNIFNMKLDFFLGNSQILPKIGENILCLYKGHVYAVGKVFYAILINSQKICLQVLLKKKFLECKGKFFLSSNNSIKLKRYFN
ncbi:tRNA-modifying protein YgfZ [Buchnera aphidicola]|uniref:tRNA-modifying protein YgfZ n=1 Tax=Buchnera aphidicola TaxID=9 RepID=UPI0031B705A6